MFVFVLLNSRLVSLRSKWECANTPLYTSWWWWNHKNITNLHKTLIILTDSQTNNAYDIGYSSLYSYLKQVTPVLYGFYKHSRLTVKFLHRVFSFSNQGFLSDYGVNSPINCNKKLPAILKERFLAASGERLRRHCCDLVGGRGTSWVDG